MTEIGRFLKITVSQWSAHNAPRLGAALAYYTVLSIAPLLIVIVAIAGFVFGEAAARGQLVWEIQDMVGKQGADAIQAMLQNAHKPATGIFATIVGVITLLLGASAVFGELRDSLNFIWGAKPREGSGVWDFLRYRFFSFALVLGIGFLLLVSLALSAFLASLGGWVEKQIHAPEILLHVMNVLVSLVAITLLFALIYRVIPDVGIEWSDVWIGAGVTSLLFTIGKLLIGLYLGKASVGSAYGAAGSLVVLLVWIYYSAQIIFFGAEFTHVYAMREGSRSAKKPSPEQRPENLNNTRLTAHPS